MHFTGSAARWWQSVERHLKGANWREFSTCLLERFGRDKHEHLIRQLFHIRQTTTIAVYIEKFFDIIDQLSAYETKIDPLFYTMRFIDGLKDSIKSSVLLHRLATLDSACALAQLQEEVMEPSRSDARKSFYARGSSIQQPLPLPRPPPSDRLPTDGGKRPQTPRSRPGEDKLASLKAYRRARGLYDKCAKNGLMATDALEQSSCMHWKEMWDLFHEPDAERAVSEADNTTRPKEFMAISLSATSRTSAPYIVRLHSICLGQSISILIDSVSTHSFVSDSAAAHLKGASHLLSPVSVKVADGSRVPCTHMLPSAEWTVQGYSFKTDLRIFPLAAYDVVLGMDWLEAYSPMKIHWKDKWISMPYQGKHIVLQGVLPLSDQLDMLHVVYLLQSDNSAPFSVDLDPIISSVLHKHQTVFEEPKGLPPFRSCDHTIPLILGAQLVFIRPYRYAPAVKDEIKTQVANMLQSGIIQHSTCPFSSPVLLVRKKDNSWCFCVDFRHLNAMTSKRKYPVPIIDEFLDELQGASWFSSLDLHAGFHQILLKEGEEFKTAFQTHSGHYEFRVMAFGLTGAPATFQSAMNNTLRPVLRKFALVFFDDILVYSSSLDDHAAHLDAVLGLLHQDQWKVKMSKCTFAARSISYLGHVISSEGVQTDPQKVTAVVTWPTPTNTKELRSFLGLAGYYRKFVKHFGIISKPLTNLLKKNITFCWTQEHDMAF
jgi:hypothetical protein